MKAIRFTLGLLLFLALFASASRAQVQRTFVSGLGSDSNPCNRTAPCRTFAQAILGTNPGGEVIVLDSAGYGAFTISKAVSIVAPPGVYAGISVFSGDGIDVNAGGNDTVILRGLTVNDQGSTGSGIVFLSNGTLHVESCVVNGFKVSNGGNGILCNGGGKLEVKDSILRGNGSGIFITGGSDVAVDQVRLEGSSGQGLDAEDGAKVTVRNSVASDNQTGFFAFSHATANVDLNIESCVISNNFFNGIRAQSNSTGIATVRLSSSMVTDNATGLVNVGSPALLLSRGNNTVEGNTTDTSGTIGSYTAK
jgi:nitrous oxidase accessory protein NosD